MADLVEQLRQLAELHQGGSLSDVEFDAAKNRLLNGAPQPAGASNSLIVLQNELAALDRQWMLEREQYQITTRYGSSIPKEDQGNNYLFTLCGFGVFWMCFSLLIGAIGGFAKASGTFWILPLGGIVMIVMGITGGKSMTEKFDAYQRAEAHYQSRRAEVETQIRALS